MKYSKSDNTFSSIFGLIWVMSEVFDDSGEDNFVDQELCGVCGEGPCCEETYKHKLRAAIQFSGKYGDEGLKTPCQLSIRTYNSFIQKMYSYLGKGNRVPLYICIEKVIKEMYPEPSGVYHGLKDRKSFRETRCEGDSDEETISDAN